MAQMMLCHHQLVIGPGAPAPDFELPDQDVFPEGLAQDAVHHHTMR